MTRNKRGKGNGLHGITNMDKHVYSEDELEQKRLRIKDYFRDHDEERAKKRFELRVK